MRLKVRGHKVNREAVLGSFPKTNQEHWVQIDDKRVLSAFGEQVKRIRLDIGISQERLALKSGMDRTYISGIERGERNVSLLNLFKLATALSVEPQQLVGFEHGQ